MTKYKHVTNNISVISALARIYVWPKTYFG